MSALVVFAVLILAAVPIALVCLSGGILVFEGSTRGGLPRTLELRYPLGRGATASIPFRVPR